VATSLAVLAFFARAPRDENARHRLIAPALAAVALLAMVWSGLTNYATLLGVAPGSTEAWAPTPGSPAPGSKVRPWLHRAVPPTS
jgi:hypothetical protein